MNSRSLFALILFLVIMIVLTVPVSRFLHKIPEEPLDETPLKLGECSGALTILYDNNPCDLRLRTAWGFSGLVTLNTTTVLFDTGGDGRLLIENMAKLGVNASDIQIIVLSHIHGDHTGGLDAVLEANNNVTVYLPASFPSSFKRNVEGRGGRVVEVQQAVKVCDCAATTGVLGVGIEEQSLMVKTQEGLVVLTGCAHPEVVNIVREAKKLTGDEVYLVLGGFHLASKSEKEIIQIISEMEGLGVRKVAPCHCSGDTARRLFKGSFGANYVEAGVGKILQIGSEA